MIGATVLIAAGAGHLVQNTGNAQSVTPVAEFVTPPATAERFELENVATLSASTDAGPELPKLPVAPLAPAALSTPENAAISERMEGLDAGQASVTDRTAAQQLNQFGMECETALTATAGKAAMVQLHVSATCATNDRIEILHGRLAFAARLSNTGTATLDVPALDGSATFLVRLSDGDILRGFVEVPDAADFERVVLQSDGSGLMELHAYEFGAGYGEDGHVWAQAPRGADQALQGKGGFMSVLGDGTLASPMVAQVYSHPKGQALNSDVVRVSIEVPITEGNCSNDLNAEALQPGPDGSMQAIDLTLAAPGCDGIGEFLVLKNVVRDLKIAAN
ncbi:hypothetical protein [Actibacterium mucosum]|nr:hypothetical protein [Actibacterium mucosum]